ncbi:hypothetical protein D9C73_027363 [Collichthys lucidus]|uniref:Uncharacterized protein n=1 Tax=Collichthys lucidus TaxID=240159 RepID=A0A4U5VW70_COLLU|nr:hypothetical protein D9C73_027363 [Collichthys lucidus]
MESKQVMVFMKHLVSRDPSEFSSNSNMKCCFSDPEVSLRSGPTSKDPASSCPKLAPRAWMGTEGSRGLCKPESLIIHWERPGELEDSVVLPPRGKSSPVGLEDAATAQWNESEVFAPRLLRNNEVPAESGSFTAEQRLKSEEA